MVRPLWQKRCVYLVTTEHQATTYHSSLMTPHQWNQVWISSLQHNFPFKASDLDNYLEIQCTFSWGLQSLPQRSGSDHREHPPSVTRKIRVRRVMRKIRKMRRLLLDPAESCGSWATISTLKTWGRTVGVWWVRLRTLPLLDLLGAFQTNHEI